MNVLEQIEKLLVENDAIAELRRIPVANIELRQMLRTHAADLLVCAKALSTGDKELWWEVRKALARLEADVHDGDAGETTTKRTGDSSGSDPGTPPAAPVDSYDPSPQEQPPLGPFSDGWCRNCGHKETIHDKHEGTCSGVHVRGMANSPDAWEQLCSCFGYAPLSEERSNSVVEPVDLNRILRLAEDQALDQKTSAAMEYISLGDMKALARELRARREWMDRYEKLVGVAPSLVLPFKWDAGDDDDR